MPQSLPPELESIKEKVLIRPMGEADFNFVLSSWLKTYKYSGPSVRRITDRIYYEAYEPIVKDLIKRSDVYVAALREEPEIIVGYLAIERKREHDTIHFCLVKELWRKMRVASYLIEAAGPGPTTFFTHWTSPIDSLINKIPYIYNPFI